jgi:outer membrane scaffolding protein for murein synthesis (MipA/OmpV family)
VAQTERWNVGLGARLTHGRHSADDAMLVGLPDIKSSIGLRASARYTLAPGWRLSGNLQQDLLRSQGLRGSLGVGWTQPVGSGWVLDVNGGINVANTQAMNTFFGVADAGARPGRPAWQASGGVESWFWGVGLTRALSPHWRVAGSVGRGTLLGDAARSPLTVQRSGHVAQVSLAYVGW